MATNAIGHDFPETAASDHEKARAILSQLFRRRRLLPDEENTPDDFEAEIAPHLEKILSMVKEGKPIRMILPAFPFKSPNRGKTLGPLPDFAEKHALEQLHGLCQRLGAIHPPGAKLVICSDGRVFADLLQTSDEDVSAYGKTLREFAHRIAPDTFEFFNLDDVFTDLDDYDVFREELLICYGEGLRSLRKRCQEEKHARAMYQGITRFIFEDYLGIDPFRSQSRTSVQKVARVIAYRVIQRSNAWSRLLQAHFSEAIRLSIHPQYRVSEKIGVFLGEADSAWTTPWHSVAVKENGKVMLRKRAEVEQANGMLLFVDGRPSHYEMPAGESDPRLAASRAA